MIGDPLPPHPLLRVEPPAWPEPPEDDDLAGFRGIILAGVLGTLLWAAGIAIWVWLRWLS